VLAGIEVLTAAFGLFSLAIFDQVAGIAAALPLAAAATLALALVIVPTLLMGATLPILVGYLARRSGNVGSAVGLLYYVNTLGAGAACFVATLLLFPFIGMQGAVNVAVALNMAVAVGAIAGHLFERRGTVVAEAPAAAARTPVLRFAPAMALACLGGFVSLSYEIFLFRVMSYATGSSATAFAATLGAFLVGIAVGARQAGCNCEAARDDVMARMVLDLMVANLVGALFLPILGLLSWLGGAVAGMALLMTYLIARYWGSFLPYLAELGIVPDASAGMRTALIYLANIVGAAAGSIVTGFVLMDVLTLTGIAGWLVAIGLGCAIVLFAMLPVARERKHTLAIATAGFGLVALLATPVVNADILEHLQQKGYGHQPLAQSVENRSGIITVDQAGWVFGNGMYDGKFTVDLTHDTNGILRPYALSLFHPAPRDVLMIGLSSGSWAQVIANNPAVNSLTIIEINPGYVQLVAQAPEVASVLTHPKVKIITDDGRRWLRVNDHRFDAIVSNTTWHFRANASNLLSREFLALVKDHLAPGGVFFYNTTGSERAQRTACLGFRHGARFTNHMVMSNAPIDWDFQRWQQVLEAYRIDGRAVLNLARPLDRSILDHLMSWETNLVLGPEEGRDLSIESCKSVLARTAGKQVITDNNMGTEWRMFLGLE
jgi:spermidine synthase